MEWIRWWHKLMMKKNIKFAKLLLLMASEWYECLYSCHLIVISTIYYTGRSSSRFAWFLTLMVLAGMAALGTVGYIFYKYRLRVSSPYEYFWHVQLFHELELDTGKWPMCIENMCDFIMIFAGFCSLTWTQRSWLSCPSICHSTTKTMRFSHFGKV